MRFSASKLDRFGERNATPDDAAKRDPNSELEAAKQRLADRLEEASKVQAELSSAFKETGEAYWGSMPSP